MKPWVTYSLIFLLLAVSILVITITSLFFLSAAIYPKYVYVEGKRQDEFSECNPCSFDIMVENYYQFFDDLRFGVYTGWGGTGSLQCACFNYQSICPDCTRCKSGYELCQAFGYQDVGCPEPPQPDCHYCEIQCYRYPSIPPTNWIEIRYDSQVVYRADYGGTIPTETDNIAQIINLACKYHIEEAAKDIGAYQYECPVGFSVYSESSGGSFELSDSPNVITLCSVGQSVDADGICFTPTTTTTTTSTTTTTIPPEGVLELIFEGMVSLLGLK